MHGRVWFLAGGGGHAGYAYASAQVLHEKESLSFLAPEGDATKILKVLKNVEKNLDRRHK